MKKKEKEDRTTLRRHLVNGVIDPAAGFIGDYKKILPSPCVGWNSLYCFRIKAERMFQITEMIQKKALHNYIEIVLKRLIFIEIRPVDPDSDKCFLHYILRCCPVTDDRICKVYEPDIIQVKKGLITVMIPLF